MGSDKLHASMKIIIVGIIYILTVVDYCLGHTQGWSRLFQDEISEFHDEDLTWELGGNNVPAWLSGRYIKNGPARLNFPNQTRFYTNWMDGENFTHLLLMVKNSNFLGNSLSLPSMRQQL